LHCVASTIVLRLAGVLTPGVLPSAFVVFFLQVRSMGPACAVLVLVFVESSLDRVLVLFSCCSLDWFLYL